MWCFHTNINNKIFQIGIPTWNWILFDCFFNENNTTDYHQYFDNWFIYPCSTSDRDPRSITILAFSQLRICIQELPASVFFCNIKIRFFFSKWSNLHKRSEIGWIERKIKFQIFQFLFFEFWSFLLIFVPQFSMNFHDNSKNKNRKHC